MIRQMVQEKEQMKEETIMKVNLRTMNSAVMENSSCQMETQWNANG